MITRYKKGKFISNETINWSNFGCIYDCIDCPLSYKRSYMIRGKEFYSNYDDLAAELASAGPVLKVSGSPMSSSHLCGILDFIKENYKGRLIHNVRYIDEGCERYIGEEDTVIYRYNALIPLESVETTLDRLPLERTAISITPVSNLLGIKDYMREIKVIISALEIFRGIYSYIDILEVEREDCISNKVFQIGKKKYMLNGDLQISSAISVLKELQ